MNNKTKNIRAKLKLNSENKSQIETKIQLNEETDQTSDDQNTYVKFESKKI